MKILILVAGYMMLVGGCVQQSTGKSQSAGVNGSAGSGNANVQHIIFGRYCGHCISAKCAPMYKADFVNKKIFFDNSSNYNQGKPLDFSRELAADNFKHVSNLDKSIPDSLYLSTEKRFGCPDCADQCGIYLEIKKGDRNYNFELDNRTSNMNGYIVSFADQLQDIISKLSKVP